MNVLLWPFRGLWKIYFFAFFIFSLLLLYPFFYLLLLKEKRFPYAFSLKRFWALLLQSFSGIYVQIDQQGKLPDPPYIICPNHSSYLDIILTYRVFKNYFVFLGKQEIAKWPLFRIFFTSNMNILVDRGKSISSHKSLIRAAEEIDKGHSLVIFPEGGIPDHAPIMRKFKNGAFKLAIEKQIPIVPVTFTSNWKLMQGSKLLKGKAGPGISRVIIHEPIVTTGLTEKDLLSLRDKTFEMINQPLLAALEGMDEKEWQTA